MGFYDSIENVEMYVKMAEGYNGQMFYDLLVPYLEEGSKVLELGAGEGKDIKIFSEKYHVIGSDSSEVFVNMYNKTNEENPMLLLNAETINGDETYDCIYSNKVLQHVTKEGMIKSISQQYKHLNKNGIIIHSLWYGSGEESFDGMLNIYYTEKDVKEFLGDQFEILELERYTEMDKNDSLYFIARVK